MFYPSEITLATFPTIAWLLPIAIIIPVDVIVIGTLLLIATRARRSVTESSFLSSGVYRGRRYWKYGFYVNPEDGRLWVPRPQNPRSRTINIGHPNGIRAFALFVGGLTLLPTVILAVVFLVLALTLP